LIAIARSIMAEERFEVGDAFEFTFDESWDVVAACGVMLYLPSWEKAEHLITVMASAARRSIVLLDLPDVAHRDQAESFRRSTLGEDLYRERYRGLGHLYFDRDEIRRLLLNLDFEDITIADQDLENYPNGTFRFNVIARRTDPPAG
jgi:trans-aconitate methyltransferase